MRFSNHSAGREHETFASLRSVLSCITNTPFGFLQSYYPPHAAHHQLLCFFPCSAGTQQNKVFKRARMTERTYDSVTPPCPSIGAMVGLRKSVLFCRIGCAMLLRPSSCCKNIAAPLTLVHALRACHSEQLRPVARFSSVPRLSDHGTVQLHRCCCLGYQVSCPQLFWLRSVPTPCFRILLPPRKPTVCLENSFRRSFVFLCKFQVAAIPTEVDRVRSSFTFHQTGCDVKELEAFSFAPFIAREPGRVASSRIACRTWHKAQLLHALVSAHLQIVLSARFVFLRFR